MQPARMLPLLAAAVASFVGAPRLAAQDGQTVTVRVDSLIEAATQASGLAANIAEVVRQVQVEALGELGTSLQLDLSDARVYWGGFDLPEGETIEQNVLVIGGDARIRGTVTGNLVTKDGNVRLYPGGFVDGDVTTVDGRVIGSSELVSGRISTTISDDAGSAGEPEMTPLGPVGTVARGSLTLLGLLAGLAAIGFGLSFFGHNQLEMVAQRIIDSPGKSFLAGMFAQPLILPAMFTVAVALVLTIVGVIVVIPAIVLMAGAVVLSMLVGYLAVARVIGAHYALQRAERRGETAARITPWQAMTRGLMLMLAMWLPVVLLAWVPAAGMAMAALAGLLTWIAVTTGLGAVITTRGAGTLDRMRERTRLPGHTARS